MSDFIPFEIQSEIMKSLPVKSLIQFRSVSKQWKAFIDDPEFIKNYHIHHTNPQHHLLVSYKLSNTVKTYTSILDNNTFPQHKLPLTAPDSLRLLRNTITLGSVDGLLCFCGFYGDVNSKTRMAVIWNPTVRKSVGIVVIPKAGYNRTSFGFGVSPDTSDPKLVKISVSYRRPISWKVDVFTLSTRVWKTVYAGPPFRPCNLMWHQVFVNGVIYFRASDLYFANQVRSNFIISYDIKSDKFGEVCLPERLVVRTPYVDISVAKVNGSLGLLEYYKEGDMRVCGVWTRTDDANKTFSKIYTVKVVGESLLSRVLGFRNKGEAVMELMDDDDNNKESIIEVYEPLSGHTIGVGINGKQGMFSARSYMETLLLLDESDSIIR